MKLNILAKSMHWTLRAAENKAMETSNVNLKGLALDSRRVQSGYGFIAIAGETSHGNDYVTSAIANGALVIFTDKEISASEQNKNVVIIFVADLASQLSKLVAIFYQQTFDNLQALYAITGTNGKTTVAQLIAQSLSLLDSKTAILGTAGNGFFNALEKAELTTMDVISSCETITAYRKKGAKNIAMEASSHGLVQQRLNGIPITTAILTNITQDHLDYHHDMVSYKQAKLRLFTEFNLKNAVINLDSEYAQEFIDATNAHAKEDSNEQVSVITYSRKVKADVMLLRADITQHSMKLICQIFDKSITINTQLIGAFNIENLLATMAALVANGYDVEAIAAIMPDVKSVDGRMQVIKVSDMQPLVIVDFAHTPDALSNVLSTLKNISNNAESNLWVVFGCGGDRDKTKRSLMGKVASSLADKVVVTSDNPRTENAQEIIDEIITGIDTEKVTRDIYTVISNREDAIYYAIKNAKKNDTIVIAGKGHETGQIIGNEILPFKDSDVVKKVLKECWL